MPAMLFRDPTEGHRAQGALLRVKGALRFGG